jgi:hypothetical protein
MPLTHLEQVWAFIGVNGPGLPSASNPPANTDSLINFNTIRLGFIAIHLLSFLYLVFSLEEFVDAELRL